MKRPITIVLALTFLILSITACNQENSKTTSKDFDGDETAKANVKTGVKPEPDSQVAVIETADYGRIVVELYPNIAPKMVEQFKKLINEHFYDGTAIHRIDPDLGIIQGGAIRKQRVAIPPRGAQETRIIRMCRRNSATSLTSAALSARLARTM